MHARGKFGRFVLPAAYSFFTLFCRWILGEPIPARSAGEAGKSTSGVRDVRVLIASDPSRIQIRSDGRFTISSSGHRKLMTDEDRVVLAASGTRDGGLRVGGENWPSREVTAQPEGGGSLWITTETADGWSPPLEYPGQFHIAVSDSERLNVINAVEIDTYVGCVVANESWPSFEPETFRIQAIASRSFVLYQMNRRPDAEFDLSATQGSQVYKGLRRDAAGRTAMDAAESTRGLVVTWGAKGEERLFCAYYSAACGGESQSAAALGAEGNVPPLAGGIKCDFCRISPAETYRWGPVRLTLDEIRTRLITRYPDWEDFGPFLNLSVAQRSPAGRPVTLRIEGVQGRTRDLLAERFRLAVGGSILRSTDCRIRVSGGEVIFDNGKGFGHGLGLCQWGAQGQVLKGRNAAEVLKYYYPGANVTRAY